MLHSLFRFLYALENRYMKIVHSLLFFCGENLTFSIFTRVIFIQLCFSSSDDYISKERMRYKYLGKL